MSYFIELEELANDDLFLPIPEEIIEYRNILRNVD